MDIINKDITNYLEGLIKNSDQLLKEMEEYAKKHDFPIIGPLVGHFLMQYTQILKPERILELGSGYGYSAIWFSRGGSESLKIFCTDGSQENADMAKSYFKKEGISNQINFIVGDAVSSMKEISGEFDIIFCDIDKEGYPEAFMEAIPRLKSGGIMITDNTLWSGRILDKNNNEDSTIGVRKFNNIAFSDPRVISNIIPIRDGVCVSYKK